MTAPPTSRRIDRLLEICNEMFSQRRLILASNRGPVEYNVEAEGRLQARRGSGGVVTALSSLTKYVDFTWISSAMREGDRRAAAEAQGERIKSPIQGQQVSLRYVVTPKRVYHKFYNIFCNPLLWFLQHYMWSSPYTPNIDLSVHDAWDNGYVQVNKAFADTVIAEAQGNSSPPYIMLHDYHLYLAPGYIRKELPGAVIEHFTHIPWPSVMYWQLLPSHMRVAICESLCASDIVGFQSMRDVRSFLESCEAFIPGAQVDYSNQVVNIGDHQAMIRAYPISIDVEELRRIATSPRAMEYETRLKALCGEKTIVRIDRAEPSKNIIRGFKAFLLLLERYPELRRKLKFLAFIVPSRTHIGQYQRYITEIQQQISDINSKFGDDDWQPVTVFYENNYTQAIAAMRLYDVLLVNPVIDGMNLVSKEGPVVNTKAGVLILSEAAGAFQQLKDGVIGVAPADLEGTMQAMYYAINMTAEERERRSAILVEAITQEDITNWLERQLLDMKALV